MMTNTKIKKTKEQHAAGVREHSKKYGFPVKQKGSKNKSGQENLQRSE